MADEYIARMSGGTVPLLSAVARQLCDAGVCEMESTPAEVIHLRWAGMPRRNDWPEDITLSLLREGVLLTIHSGTADRRARLIELAASILTRETGVPACFEEA